MFTFFEENINGPLSFLNHKRLLIAISGGVDSVVLAHLCHRLKLNFSLAHCNFNLRGEESNADEDFVIQLGEKLGVEVFVQNFDIEGYCKAKKTSVQMAARELRYDWLNELAELLNYDYVLTAHHADDNLETFLINFTRGTGLNGLTGIPIVNEKIVRPLLPFSRDEILEYANVKEIVWREDSSNIKRKYLRNKLRHDVIPMLKEINPQLLDNFQDTLSHLNDSADIVEESLNAVAKRAIVSIDESGITYKVSEFKKVNNSHAYLFEMFKDFGFTQWDDITDLLDAETGKYVTSETHKLQKHREFLILSKVEDIVREKDSMTFEIEDVKIESEIGEIKMTSIDVAGENTDSSIYLDRDKLGANLSLRLWEQGDVFYPLGMTGKKKVSKYLKDEKLTPNEKDNTWVLSSVNSIVWVVGRRADDRFKVTDKTTNILKISVT